ncbi:DUF58 domain-containing protein [Spongiibacter sp.]|uniref:DUF58 domain-containing protein n=1 Tax=Spongiibacter sp. TaxID=2024860 RepID=UPI00356218F1
MSALRAAVRRRFEAWLDQRNPPRSEITLRQNTIFIFLSTAGGAFSVMLLGLLLLAINYQNNLVFAFCFGLFGVFLVAILHTYINLSGLRLRAGASEPVFAGDTAHFHLHIESGRRPRYQLQLRFMGQHRQLCELESAGEGAELRLAWPASQRGRLQPGRLQLRSDYPLGILRCWAMPALNWQCLVYPQPKLLRPLQSAGDDGEGYALDVRADSEEFSGFERYRVGESPRRIFWKAYAKGQGLYSKRYEQSHAKELILDWQSLGDLGVEDRLSTLCAWALECDRRDLSFSLRLPAVTVAAGVGPAHLAAVLRELALFPGGACGERG